MISSQQVSVRISPIEAGVVGDGGGGKNGKSNGKQHALPPLKDNLTMLGTHRKYGLQSFDYSNKGNLTHISNN